MVLTYRIVAVMFVVVGFSHWRNAARWADFFREVLAHRHGAWFIAHYTAPMGLLIVLTHNVWGLRLSVIATIFGWMMVMKSAVYLMAPDVTARIHRSGLPHERSFRRVGVVMMAIGAVLSIDAFR